MTAAKKMIKVIMVWCILFILTACANGIPIVSEIKDGQGYTDAQTMLIIANEKNRYRSVYTDQIWQVQVDDDGTTFHTCLVGEIQNFLRELKTTSMLADEQGITLTSQEKEKLDDLVSRYYDSLTDDDLAYTGVVKEDVYIMYEAYHRANKLVEELTKDVNLEISDNEAKVITVQEIKLKDAELAGEVYSQVIAEGADFQAIARTFSEDLVIERSVGRGERKKIYEDEVFALTTGEISPVIQDEDGFYIVKCMNDYDEEATLERKQKLELQRKNQAFRQIYDAFAIEHPVEIRGSIWDNLSFASEDGSTTTSFFKLYQEYMAQ